MKFKLTRVLMLIMSSLLLISFRTPSRVTPINAQRDTRPNIIIIMSDDGLVGHWLLRQRN
jgi:hypothetical protein